MQELKLRLKESMKRSQSPVADEPGGSRINTTGAWGVYSPNKLIAPFNEARDDLDAYLQQF